MFILLSPKSKEKTDHWLFHHWLNTAHLHGSSIAKRSMIHTDTLHQKAKILGVDPFNLHLCNKLYHILYLSHTNGCMTKLVAHHTSIFKVPCWITDTAPYSSITQIYSSFSVVLSSNKSHCPFVITTLYNIRSKCTLVVIAGKSTCVGILHTCTSYSCIVKMATRWISIVVTLKYRTLATTAFQTIQMKGTTSLTKVGLWESSSSCRKHSKITDPGVIETEKLISSRHVGQCFWSKLSPYQVWDSFDLQLIL